MLGLNKIFSYSNHKHITEKHMFKFCFTSLSNKLITQRNCKANIFLNISLKHKLCNLYIKTFAFAIIIISVMAIDFFFHFCICSVLIRLQRIHLIALPHKICFYIFLLMITWHIICIRT